MTKWLKDVALRELSSFLRSPPVTYYDKGTYLTVDNTTDNTMVMGHRVNFPVNGTIFDKLTQYLLKRIRMYFKETKHIWFLKIFK